MPIPVQLLKLLQEMTVDFNKELRNGSDRGIVLVSASILDLLLSRILASFFVKEYAAAFKDVSEGDGVLSEFSSKITMCLLLGLISEEESRSLHDIRKIRNEFAHKIGLELNDQSMADRCKNLYMRTHAKSADPSAKSPSAMFTTATVQLFAMLVGRMQAANDQRRLVCEPRVLEWSREAPSEDQPGSNPY